MALGAAGISSEHTQFRSSPAWLGWLLVVLPPSAVALRALARGPALGGGDLDFLYRPFWKYLGEALRRGRLPLWDPEMGTGIPFLASLQSQALYPPAALLFSALPLEVAIYVFSFGHLLWAALGTARVGRRIGLSREAAVGAAALVAAAPLFYSAFERPNLLAAAAWLPWLWLAGERVLEQRRGGIAALAGAATMSLLSASPEITLLGVLAVVLSAAQRARAGDYAPLWRCALAGVLGAGLAGATLVPFVELLHEGNRDEAVRGLTAAWSLGRGDLAGLFFPLLASGQAAARSFQDFFFGPFQGLVSLVYLGAPAAMLAAAGLRGGGRREAWLVSVVFTSILAAAWGGWLSEGLGLLHLGAFSWRYPIKFLFAAPFALALLAAAGIERIARRDSGGLTTVFAATGASLIVTAAVVTRTAAMAPSFPRSVAWIGVALLVLAAILRWAPPGSWRAWPLFFACAADTTACALQMPYESDTAACRRVLAAARARLSGGRVDGLAGAPLPGSRFFLDLGGPPPCLAGNVLAQYGLPAMRFYGTPGPRGGAILSRFGILGDALLGVTLFLRDRPEPRPGLEPILATDLAPYWAARVPGAPRVELRPDARVVSDVEAALKSDTLARARREVLLGAPPPAASAPGEPYSGTDVATLVRDAGERVEVTTASSGKRWLVLADRPYPGWRATSDGRRVPIVEAYGMVRAVRLGPGRHRVVFEYRPWSVRLGGLLSALTLVALGVGTFARRGRLAGGDARG